MKDLIAIAALVMLFEGVVLYEAYRFGIWNCRHHGDATMGETRWCLDCDTLCDPGDATGVEDLCQGCRHDERKKR